MTLLNLLGFLGACAAAASTGALFRPGAWYEALNRPAWTPPNRLFPVAWTLLYIAIAIAAWRVARTEDGTVPLALSLWAWQITLNAVWSPIFFGLHRIRAALAVLGLLWMVTLATTIAFYRIDFAAAWLMLAYLVWISYALALNFSVLKRNPDQPPVRPDSLR